MPDFQVEVIETRLYRAIVIVRGVENADAAYAVACFEEGDYEDRIEHDLICIDTVRKQLQKIPPVLRTITFRNCLVNLLLEPRHGNSIPPEEVFPLYLRHDHKSRPFDYCGGCTRR